MYSSSRHIWNIDYSVFVFLGVGNVHTNFLYFKLLGENKTAINCITGQCFNLTYQECLILSASNTLGEGNIGN